MITDCQGKRAELRIFAGEAGFDAAVRDEPHNGNGDVAECGNPWTEESERDGWSINDDGKFAFSVAADGSRQCGLGAMKGKKRSDEDEIGHASEKEDNAVERDGPGSEVVVAHPRRGEGNQREPEKEMEIGPENRSADALRGVEQVVMIVPIDGNHDEAEDVAQEVGNDRPERGESGCLRRFHFKDHDGDDDGEDAVAEGFETVFAHGMPFCDS